MLSLYAVDKSFGRSKILKSIDLQLDKKTYGLLGPNGAGKTTLMRCITGLYPLSAGKIEFNGSDISKDKNFQSHIGYLPQKFGLYRELTAFEMMEMLADLKGISREKIGDEAKKYIKLVGLQDKLDKKVKTLSGGMIRRLGVAQALLGEPDIIIFDEPTAGLDPEERLRFKNIVSKLEGERTIIISTHIVEDVENLCDELVIINNGTVAAQGTCAEIENAAAGKVYEIEDSRLGELSEPYFIQRQFERDSKRMTAVLSAQAQPTAASVSPRVEDGYICITKNI